MLTALRTDKPIISPVVFGRAGPLERLGDLLERAQGIHGATVLLSGEAGVGKSRLISELKAGAQQIGCEIHEGHSFESYLTVPYAPILDLLRRFLLSRASEELTREFSPTAVEFIKFLPELYSLFPGLVPPPALEAEQGKRRLFQTLVQFFSRNASTTPLLVIFEDIHWSDDASLEFFLYLARHVSSLPILLVMSYRSEEVTPALHHFLATLDRERLATELTLQPLSLAETESMIRAIFEQARPVRAEFLETVYNLTEGNPFFIEEILKSLVSAGEIFYTVRGWDRKPMSELHIPRSVQDAVQRRSLQLSPPARQLLELAAVTGRRFDFTLIQELTNQNEKDLLRLLKELIAAQFVVEESAEQFAFRHALTRQAIYSKLLSRERRALHRTIGETMERAYADRREAHLTDWAYHFYEAEVWEKALKYSQRVGEKALALYAPRAAIEHLTHAVEATQHLSTTPAAKLYRARGQAHELVSEFDAAREDYEHALAVTRATSDGDGEWQSLLDLGFLWLERDYQKGGDYFQRALALARELGDPSIIGHSLNRVGNWYVNAEQPFEGQRYHQEALDIFRSINDLRGQAETLDLFGPANFMAGDLFKCVESFEQAILLFRELDDRRGLASSLTHMTMRGGSYYGDPIVSCNVSLDECISDAEESRALARQMGWRSGEAALLNILATCLGSHGAFAQALEAAQRGLDLATEIEHRGWMCTAHFALGALYLDLLALAGAQAHFEQALALAKGTGSLYLIRTVTAFLGSTYIARQELLRAESILDAASNRTSPVQTLAERLLARARAELEMAKGAPASALRIVDEMIASSANVEGVGAIPRLSYLRSEALRALGQERAAEAELQAAQDVARVQGARPIRWRIYIALGKVYQAQARREAAEDAFAIARAIIAELATDVTDISLRENFVKRAGALIPRLRDLSPRQLAKREFSGLTERERQVAALIAQGKSNREIADALVVSHRTVEVHIGNIMSKLTVSSRSQIAVWSVEKGLLRMAK